MFRDVSLAFKHCTGAAKLLLLSAAAAKAAGKSSSRSRSRSQQLSAVRLHVLLVACVGVLRV